MRGVTYLTANEKCGIGGLVDVRCVIMSVEPYSHIGRISQQTRERGWIPSNKHRLGIVEKAIGDLEGQ